MAGQEWTQDNIFGVLEEFLELLESLDPAAYPDDGQTASSDTLFQQMCADDSLAGVRTQSGDWTGLNVPSIGGVPAA